MKNYPQTEWIQYTKRSDDVMTFQRRGGGGKWSYFIEKLHAKFCDSDVVGLSGTAIWQ